VCNALTEFTAVLWVSLLTRKDQFQGSVRMFGVCVRLICPWLVWILARSSMKRWTKKFVESGLVRYLVAYVLCLSCPVMKQWNTCRMKYDTCLCLTGGVVQWRSVVRVVSPWNSVSRQLLTYKIIFCYVLWSVDLFVSNQTCTVEPLITDTVINGHLQ
jgi:hypothetical protein